MSKEFQVPKNMRIKKAHVLLPAQAAEWLEIKQIRESAHERMVQAAQRHQDAQAILEGWMTKIKWDLGWQDGEFLAYDYTNGRVVVLESEEQP